MLAAVSEVPEPIPSLIQGVPAREFGQGLPGLVSFDSISSRKGSRYEEEIAFGATGAVAYQLCIERRLIHLEEWNNHPGAEGDSRDILNVRH